MSKKTKKPLVYAYGFDRMGFRLPQADYETEIAVIRFLDYQTARALDEADGVIIPSGIFEEIYKDEDYFGYAERQIRFDKNLLAEREKQLLNAFHGGKWVLFTLGAVDLGPKRAWTATDLAKKILLVFASNVAPHDPTPYIDCSSDEFRKYLERFGVAQTQFHVKDGQSGVRVLAKSGDDPAAIAVRGDFFFIPLFSTKRDAATVAEALSELVAAVLEYKRKNDFFLPSWLEAIRFATEEKIAAEATALEERLVALKEECKKWERYKGVLCTSGRNLSEIAVEVLRDFFRCDLKSEEKYIEDAIIYDANKQPAFVVEIKGVNGGLRREHINQVDSHRERLGISAEIPGLLIINDFMDLEDLAQRKGKAFDAQHLTHALNLNIKVLRTSEMINLMIEFEDQADRNSKFLQICALGNPIIQQPRS